MTQLVLFRRNLYIYAMRKLILSPLPILYLQASITVELLLYVSALQSFLRKEHRVITVAPFESLDMIERKVRKALKKTTHGGHLNLCSRRKPWLDSLNLLALLAGINASKFQLLCRKALEVGCHTGNLAQCTHKVHR